MHRSLKAENVGALPTGGTYGSCVQRSTLVEGNLEERHKNVRKKISNCSDN